MKYPTYPNLEAEMRRKGYSADDVAKTLNIRKNGAYRLLRGESNLSLYRARLIRDTLFPDMKLDYLFAVEDKPA